MATSECNTNSDLAYNYVQKRSDYNSVKESLTKEVKCALDDVDELNQADFQEVTTSEEDSGSDTSTSEKVKLIRSASLGKIDDLGVGLDETTLDLLSSLFKSAASSAERDLAKVKKKLLDLQSLRTRPVAKLFETTNFLQTLLDELGAGERGKELMDKMEALRIDFNQLIATTIDTNYDVEVAHQRMFDLCEQLQDSLGCAQLQHAMNYPSYSYQHYATNDIEKLQTRIAELEKSNKTLVDEINNLKEEAREKETEISLVKKGDRNEKMEANKLMESNKQLQAQINELEGCSNKEVIDELDKLKETKDEMVSTHKNMETQLLHKNEHGDKFDESCRQLQQIPETKEACIVDKERKIDEITEDCHHKLKKQITESTLTANETAELKAEVRKLTNFTRHLYLLIAQFVDDDTPGFDFPFETIDVDHLFKTYDRILNGFYYELCELRTRVALLDRSDKAYMLSEEPEQDGSSATRDGEASESISSNEMESRTVDLQTLFDNANDVVQKLKAISNKHKESEVMEILSKMRSLRYQIDSLRSNSEQFEKIKENVALSSLEEHQSERSSAEKIA